MNECFIIMQIGNSDLDKVCEQAIVPAIEVCGLDPKRVDKHNEGGLLKSEIIGFIERSDIIVADLTNERPNCYLEVGYAMGMDKFRNLILTVREDHNPESVNYKNGGAKVHFDLSGYDLLYWHPDRLDEFRDELIKRIKRRQLIQKKTNDITPESPWDDDWLSSHSGYAWAGLEKTKKGGFLDIRFALDHPKPQRTQKELLEAASESVIKTFGWPIAIYMTSDGFAPKPRVDGIVAEISTEEMHGGGMTYDYWTIRRNGDFFLLKTIFEDKRDPEKIFFNTRIVRVTETLLYCARLYERLGIDPTTYVNIEIVHGGLKGRIITAAGASRMLSAHSRCEENQIKTQVRSTLAGLESNLVDLVKELTEPMFSLFGFCEFKDEVYQDIVSAFVDGQIT